MLLLLMLLLMMMMKETNSRVCPFKLVPCQIAFIDGRKNDTFTGYI